MTDEDTRKQIEEDVDEDLELTADAAGNVGGGDDAGAETIKKVPGRLNPENIILKRG